MKGSRGVKDATIDEQKIRQWWTATPNANIGLACGKASGVSVIDVDYDEERGINGYESLRDLPVLPATYRQGTPRGGFHAIYATDNPPLNRNDWKPGIDIRGEGFYIVLYPSITKRGKYLLVEDDVAPYPDAFRPEPTKPKAPRPLPALAPPTPTTGNDADLMRRVSKYMESVEPAVQGGGGHNKIFWAAQCLIHGWELDLPTAYQVLATEYNPRCTPPWNLSDQKDEKDFRRKLEQAQANPPSHLQRGWLRNAVEYSESTTIVDIDSIMKPVRDKIAAQINQKTGSGVITLDEKDSKALEFLTKPSGALGEICSWINSCSMKPQPFLAIGATLTFLGALYGRKIKDRLDSRTNLYCMGIADSSAGKNAAPKMLRKLAFASDCIDLLGGFDIASDSAIEERMANKPSTALFLDEIGLLLSDIKDVKNAHKSNVIATLMRLWSSAGDIFLGREYADKEKQRKLVEPCLSIWGVSVPENFAKGISVDQISDGWLGRCLIFHTADMPRKDRAIEITTPPERLVEHCRFWMGQGGKDSDGKTVSNFVRGEHNAEPGAKLVPTSSAAEKIYIELDDMAEAHLRTAEKTRALWSKAEENARRIGLILAASDNPEAPEVSGANALYASTLVKYTIDTFKTVIEPKVFSGVVEKTKWDIVEIVEAVGKGGIPKWMLGRKTQGLTIDQRDRTIKDLVECGRLIEKAGIKGRGRSSTKYWTPDHYAVWLKENPE